jgi:hypothetical protein
MKSLPGDFGTRTGLEFATNTSNNYDINKILAHLPCKGKFPCINLCDKTEVPNELLLGYDSNSEGKFCCKGFL